MRNGNGYEAPHELDTLGAAERAAMRTMGAAAEHESDTPGAAKRAVMRTMGAAAKERPPQVGGVTRRAFVQAAGTVAAATATAALLGGCRSEAGDAFFRGERTITDHANRTITIPTSEKLERIYYTSALAQVWVFSLDPEKPVSYTHLTLPTTSRV